MALYGLHHVGIGVSDMERSLAFYRDLLELEVVYDLISEDNMMCQVIGRSAVTRVVMLKDKLGGNCVKLVQILPSRYPHRPQTIPPDRKWGDIGYYCELAMQVANLRNAYNALMAKGATSAMSPSYFQAIGPNGEVAVETEVAYFVDPDGAWFEIHERREVPKGFEDFPGVIQLTHGCLGVSNMDQSLSFYREILGFKELVYDIELEDWDFSGMGKLVGGPVRVRLAIVRSEGRGGFLELVQPLPPYKVRSLSPAARWGDIGQMEHGVEVKDLDKVCSELAQRGVRFMCSPSPVPQMKARHCYIQDPDDAIIELIDLLD